MKKGFVLFIFVFLLSYSFAKETLIKFKDKNYYGLLNDSFQISLPAEQKKIELYENFIIVTNKEGKNTVCDYSLKAYLSDNFGYVKSISPTLFQFSKQGNNYLYDIKTQSIINLKNDNIKSGNESNAIYYPSGTYYLKTDFLTKTLLKENIIEAYPFVDGIAVVMINGINDAKKNEYVIIDINGNVILNHIKDTAEKFSEGLLPVVLYDGTSGFVDRNGVFKIKTDMFVWSAGNPRMEPNIVYRFKDGKSIIRKTPAEWFILDRKGTEIPFPEDLRTNVYVFSENFVPVYKQEQENRKYGYLTSAGEIIIPCILDYAESFYNGYACVVYEGQDAILSKDGNLYIVKELLNGNKSVYKNVYTTESDFSLKKLFSQNYVIKEHHDVETKLSDGVLFETLQNSTGEELYRLSLFSSLGQTIYSCKYSDKEGVWYLEKKSIFYNEPYNQKDYEQEVSIFRYADTCYKLTGDKFIKDTDVSSAPAVVDFRSAKSIIELIENEKAKRGK